jgi:hypothetical protein
MSTADQPIEIVLARPDGAETAWFESMNEMLQSPHAVRERSSPQMSMSVFAKRV